MVLSVVGTTSISRDANGVYITDMYITYLK